MAAIASVRGDPRALTPPSSSHSDERPWGHSRQQTQAMQDKNASAPHKSSHRLSLHQNSAMPSSTLYQYDLGGDNGTRKMSSLDNLYGSKWDKAVDSGLSTSFSTDSTTKMARSDWSSSNNHSSGSDDSRPAAPPKGLADDKWIHRDKLAKIENDELQAAGFYIPRPRAQSKQRRDRSTRRDADASDDGHSQHQSQTPPKSDFVLGELEGLGQFWDPRTPEEIAEDEANHYFAPNGSKGGSRIPVAKVSPAPISQDYLEREVPASRKASESPEGETTTIYYSKNRSRSTSTIAREAAAGAPARTGQRSATDASPKKAAANKKTPGTHKSGTETSGRPKTRSGSTTTRPRTRSGDAFSNHRAPEGDPPWMFASYKPDPRLPPEQQIIPTVARRLAQEKWEKEGKFGDAYDKDFRPLNDNALLDLAALKSAFLDGANEPASQEENLEEAEEKERKEETKEQSQDQAREETQNQTQEQTQEQTTDQTQDAAQAQSAEWPFKPELSQSSTVRQGSSYSTMPKVSDRPPVGSVSSRPTSMSVQAVPEQKSKNAQQKDKIIRVPSVPDEQEKKAGCACCVVM